MTTSTSRSAPDGSTWKEAIVIDRSSGAVTLPFTASGGGSGTARRNRWINSALQVSQQNGNTAGTTDGYYVADQLSVHRVTLGRDDHRAACCVDDAWRRQRSRTHHDHDGRRFARRGRVPLRAHAPRRPERR
ncbi:MAG: hypothetical protein WDN31_01320 [Hyphomicrobium sp.]